METTRVIKTTFLKFFITFLLSFCGYFTSFATHIRAGDLTAERIAGSGLTYRFTMTVYRDISGVQADMMITFTFGDGTSGSTPIASRRMIANSTEEIIYTVVHTYPAPAEYKVGVGIENRNDNILNIANAVNTPFYVQSTFFISPFLGFNRSPILTIPPIDLAASRQRFVHNPGAIDADGDSLSYELVNCKKARDVDVDGYRLLNDPSFGATTEAGNAPSTLTLNPRTGDLIWDAPLQPGQYNVAFFVNEWRNGVLIGRVNRDMQIIVRDIRNRRPQVIKPRDTCVVAGTLIQSVIRSTDPDGDRINLSATSGLFSLTAPSNRATFDTIRSQPPLGNLAGNFRWQTTCNDISNQPYNVIFRSEDFPRNINEKLVDIQTWSIRVVAPPPTLQSAVYNPQTRQITLNWANYTCPLLNSTMTIWRRVGSNPFTPTTCQTGLTGYTQIGEVPIGTTNFIDASNLQRGVTYCYRIYAAFPAPKGGESPASMEFCVTIPINAPYITNVSVEQTSKTAGEIFVRWTKPLNLNLTNFPRPHTYRLARAENFSGTTAYNRFTTVFNENDTTFTDRNLDTQDKVYNYRVLFFSQGNLIDSSAVASSVRLSATASSTSVNLSWQYQVPWNNQSQDFRRHYIYRERLATPNTFDLIDSVEVTGGSLRYTDTGRFQNMPLQKGRTYCYYVQTVGTYGLRQIAAPLLNKSQKACGSVRDSIPPCAASGIVLEPLNCSAADVTSICGDVTVTNNLQWAATLTAGCDRFISGYRVYFAPNATDSLKLLTEIRTTATTATYAHTGLKSFAGRYAISVLDTAGNESPLSNIVEKDNCPFYNLPNVISPSNGDGLNDTFRPICYRFVEKVEFEVYNRWGGKVFEKSDDVEIRWAGVTQNGTPVAAGLYYYVAKVTYKTLRPTNSQITLKGWIQVLRE
jgi:gliding motility-associated-like protein